MHEIMVEKVQLKAPIEIEVDLTNACNLQCIHCYNESSPKNKYELPLFLVKKIIDEAAKIEVFSISLMGGEPLLYPYFFDVADYCRKKEISYETSTNGTLITDKYAKKFSEYFEIVQVSLNAATDETYKKFTGTNNFQKCLNGIKCLIRNDVQVNVAAVITEINKDELIELTKLSAEVGASSIRLMNFLPAGRGKNNAYLMVKEEESLKIRRLVERTAMEYGIEYIEDYYHCPVSANSIGQFFQTLYGCRATRTLCITPKGNVVPCALLSEEDVFFAGNVYEKTVEECWKTPQFYYFLGYRGVLEGKCKKCPVVNKCPSCRAFTYLITKNLYAPDPNCPFTPE